MGESQPTTKIQPSIIAAHTKAVMSWRLVRAFCIVLISRSKPRAVRIMDAPANLDLFTRIISLGIDQGLCRLKLGHCEIPIRPLMVKTGQRPAGYRNKSEIQDIPERQTAQQAAAPVLMSVSGQRRGFRSRSGISRKPEQSHLS